MFSRLNRSLLFANFNFSKCNVHSMLRLHNTDLGSYVGRVIKVQGWIHAVRKMKNYYFIDLSDGSTPKMLQVVVPKAMLDHLQYGSSVIAEGTLGTAPNGRLELHASNLDVIGTCDVMDGYPFAPRKTYPEDYSRKYLHLRPRTKEFLSLFRLRDIASAAIENNLRSRGFVNIHTPVLTSNDCEGAGETFLVQPSCKETLKIMQKKNLAEEESYFDTKAYLTVSGQLHLEAVARALTKVYTFGPTFRAENCKSRLHLSEFRMLEVELAFVNNIYGIVTEVEQLVKGITKDIFDKGASDIHEMKCSEPQWLNEQFACMTYDEAFSILQNNMDQFTHPLEFGTAFSKEHEFFLLKHNNDIPTFVINWPKESKPFYMKEYEDDTSKVAAMDLLVPTVGELVGGGIREDNYEKLKSKLPSPNLAWYLELRKYGNVSTGGFGIGFERFMQCLLGIPNIKDTLPFPRWPHNCSL